MDSTERPLATLAKGRSRWDGVLDAEELDRCRRDGLEVGYDCAQGGWVLLSQDEHGGDRPSPTIGSGEAALSSHDATDDQLRKTIEDEVRRTIGRLLDGGGDPDADERRLLDLVDEAVDDLATTTDLVETFLTRLGLESVVVQGLAEVRGSRHADMPIDDAITFRPWTPDDAETYVELLANPRVWTHLPEPYPDEFTVDTARSLIEVGRIGFHHETVAIEVDGRPIGQCLLRFDRPAVGLRTAEVAYWLGEDHWGRGWMSHVLPTFTLRSFERHQLDVIYAWILPENLASRRAAEKSGYRRTEFAREAEIAEAVNRRGFTCYVTHRADWSVENRIADVAAGNALD